MTLKGAMTSAALTAASGVFVVAGLQADTPPVPGAWSPGEITALVGAIGIVITAVFVGVVNILGALKKRVDEVAETVKVVEGHVNSAATKQETIIKAQDTQLEMQRVTIAKLEQTAALVAQARSLALVAAAAVPVSPPDAATPTPAPTRTIAAVADAAHTLSDALPTLDSIKETGEDTNTVVKEIKKKPKRGHP